MIISVRNLRSEKSALKWLVLIGLLWAQFAYAGHLVAHDADDLDEPCQVCSSCEQLENALADAVCVGTIAAAANALPAGFAIFEAADRPRTYSARASPQSPDSNT